LLVYITCILRKLYTYLNARLYLLERVRRLKMDFQNAISQWGNEVRAQLDDYRYFCWTEYWILTKIIQMIPYNQLSWAIGTNIFVCPLFVYDSMQIRKKRKKKDLNLKLLKTLYWWFLKNHLIIISSDTSCILIDSLYSLYSLYKFLLIH